MTEQDMDKEELRELRKENAELRVRLFAAYNKIERQRKVISDYGWQTNPDRMGK